MRGWLQLGPSHMILVALATRAMLPVFREHNRMDFSCLEYANLRGLKALVSEGEVFYALSCLGGYKTPRPNRFIMAFWQQYYDFIKYEVMNFFKEFSEQSSFVISLNATFLVLNPKKGGVECLEVFKPISLVGGLYKLLKRVIGDVVPIFSLHL